MLKTLFVVDDQSVLLNADLHTIPFTMYLQDYPKLNEPKVRVINLCDTARYLSQGYYCSLLAEARNHQVLPSVKVINMLRNSQVAILNDAALFSKDELTEQEELNLVVCMGQTIDKAHQKLAGWIYQQYPAPILLLNIRCAESGVHVSVVRVAFNELSVDFQAFCLTTLETYANKAWRTKSEQQKYRWELAILTNKDESVPPSNRGAISRFIKAAEKLGVRAREITSSDFNALGQFDALFIRETTAIDHHTYRFAHEAERLGLVVMDDANSILRCCNKVFLHDAFSYKKVPSLSTMIISDCEQETLERIEARFSYPCILKMPESAFSKGVFKVKKREELKRVASDLLSESALLIAQEYLFTEFDWRIGVIDGRALYACRYYMAKNHWQIYNHQSKRNFSGGFDAMPTFEVPASVLQAALKAASVVGNGLYGIDIKEVSGKAYVLEVNDNPSIEYGIEDKYLGNELYIQIMAEFVRRLETRGRSK